MKWAKTSFWFLIFLLAVLFSIQNRTEVTVQFLFLPMENYQWFEVPKVPLPLFFVILCSVLLGFLIGAIGNFYGRFQLKKTHRQDQRLIEKLEREIQSLRSSALDQPSFLKKDA